MDLDAIWPLVGLVTKSCLTLCDPLDCSPPGSFVPGILQSRIHFLLQGMFLTQGSNPCFLHCRQSVVLLQVDSLPTELAGKPKCNCCPYKKWEMKADICLEGCHLNMKAGAGGRGGETNLWFIASISMVPISMVKTMSALPIWSYWSNITEKGARKRWAQLALLNWNEVAPACHWKTHLS